MSAEQGDVRPEGREGMVTVYDSDDRYLGCMGREVWERLLAPVTEQGDVEVDVLLVRGSIPREHTGSRAALDRLAAALEAAKRERDNLDDNLSRVQRHLQHAVMNASAALRPSRGHQR